VVPDDHFFRREAGRLLATLTRILGVHNLALASRDSCHKTSQDQDKIAPPIRQCLSRIKNLADNQICQIGSAPVPKKDEPCRTTCMSTSPPGNEASLDERLG
jgi:hypothetical protein